MIRGGIQPLIDTLGDTYDDYEWRLAVHAQNALMKIGEPAFQPLIAASDHSDEHIRFNAIQALMRMGDKRAKNVFEEKLQDSSVAVRLQATMALGVLGEIESIPLLKKVSREDDTHFRNIRIADAAKNAIQKIQKRNRPSLFSRFASLSKEE